MGTLKRIRKKRHGTTGTWLCSAPAFNDWLVDSKSGVLWLSGILGSGKTVVTGAVIDDVLRRPRMADECIGFFFCEYDRVESLNAKTIIECLLRQCLSAESLPKSIEHQLEELFREGSYEAEDLEPLVHSVISASNAVTFIVDGFDECPQEQRAIVLSLLACAISSSGSRIKLFISSRGGLGKEINRAFETYHQVVMKCGESQEDIRAYIEAVIREKIETEDLVIGDSRLVQEIQEALFEGANGM
jgi:hypothetical protein